MLFKSCMIAALLCLASAVPQIENILNPGRVAGEYLITLKPAPEAQKASYIMATAGKIVEQTNGAILNTFSSFQSPVLHVKAEDAVISNAFEIPEVVHIEADVYEKRIEQCSSQSSGSTYWGLSRINSRAAPSYTGATYSYRTSGGSSVRVYVLDTGIRLTHQDFSGGRAVFGFNAVGGGNDDVNGHGTHCAGTVLGGNSGVAKGATAVNVKVLGDNGSGSTSGIVNGVNYVIGDNVSGRKVISMSLGGGASTTLDNAVASAVSANIPTVVAGGNENQNSCNVSPARSTSAITVGATDQSENLSSFSNWGTCTDILAPGSAIRSASSSSDSGYVSLSGTSMACPHVAGAAAVYLAQNSGATPAQVRSALTGGASSGYINLRGTSGTPNLLLYESC